MAFVSDEEENGEDVVSTAQAPGIVTPGAAPAGGTAPAAGRAKGGSGQFTNIQDYIEANRPKTAGLATGISKAVGEETTGLRTQLGQQREQYLGQEGKFGAGQQEFITQQIQQAGAQPGSEQDVARFRSLATGGEQTIDVGEQRRQAADLERRAREFQTSKGRFEGLQRLVGQQAPTYSSGQRQLDQLLLAGDRASKQQSIREMREATRGLGGEVAQLGTEVGAARGARQQEALSQLSAAQTQEQEGVTAMQQRIAESFGKGGDYALSEADLAATGLQAGQEFYGLDPTDYLQDRYSQEQYSRIGALAGLAGQETPIVGTEASRVYDPQGLSGVLGQRAETRTGLQTQMAELNARNNMLRQMYETSTGFGSAHRGGLEAEMRLLKPKFASVAQQLKQYGSEDPRRLGIEQPVVPPADIT